MEAYGHIARKITGNYLCYPFRTDGMGKINLLCFLFLVKFVFRYLYCRCLCKASGEGTFILFLLLQYLALRSFYCSRLGSASWTSKPALLSASRYIYLVLKLQSMKNSGLNLLSLICATTFIVISGCTKVYVLQNTGDGTENTGSQDGAGSQDTSQPTPGLGNNLVNFHASVESLDMTKAMSPLASGTRVTIYAYHGSTDETSSTSAVARGTYISQTAGTLSGDSGYKMMLSNGNFDFYAFSVNSSDMPPVFSNGMSPQLQNGVDYLWWNVDNYDVTGSQVTVPIVLNHSATQVTFEIDSGDGIYVQDIASATISVSKPGAQMDLTTGVIPPATEYDQTPASMGINGLKLQYIMLPLETDQPMRLTMNVHANGEPDIKTYNVDVPVPDGALEGGKSYLFRAVINGDNVTFPQVGVADWVEVDETGNPLYPH